MLLKLTDISFGEVGVINIHRNPFDTILTFLLNNGDIDARTRRLEPLSLDSNQGQVSGFVQVGSLFNPSGPCKFAASQRAIASLQSLGICSTLSPHVLVKVSMSEDYQPQFSVMQTPTSMLGANEGRVSTFSYYISILK